MEMVWNNFSNFSKQLISDAITLAKLLKELLTSDCVTFLCCFELMVQSHTLTKDIPSWLSCDVAEKLYNVTVDSRSFLGNIYRSPGSVYLKKSRNRSHTNLHQN